MKTFKSIILAAILTLGLTTEGVAQHFSESPANWKTETLRASGIDTIQLSMHSLFELPEINDTLPIIYYEPYPDSLMPRTSIEVGEITIQASSADEVIEILEEQARKLGADWVVGFNEPRRKWQRIGNDIEAVYHSHAKLLKVIDPELVPETAVHSVYCDANHLESCKEVLSWLDEHQQ